MIVGSICSRGMPECMTGKCMQEKSVKSMRGAFVQESAVVYDWMVCAGEECQSA